MFDPVSASKSPLSSRIALPIALMLAGTFGLVIVAVQPPIVSKKTIEPGFVPVMPTEVPALEVPDAVEFAEVPVGEDLIQFCSHHVTAKRSFVIFKRGTCVVINEPCGSPLAEARRILAKCDDPNARFVSEPTTEGDLIVTFAQPVFHRFAPSEISKLEPGLEKTAMTLLSPAESVAAGEAWSPPAIARYGLVARRRMLEDAAQAEPLKIVRARQRAIVSR